MTNYNDDDLVRIKDMISIYEPDTEEDDELIRYLDRAYRDFRGWLMKQDIPPTQLPAMDDDLIDWIRDIEAQCAAGLYYAENIHNMEAESDREESDERSWNTNLALYYQTRKNFYKAKYVSGLEEDEEDVLLARGSSADEDVPESMVIE